MGVEGRRSFIVVLSIPVLPGLVAPRSRAFLLFTPIKGHHLLQYIYHELTLKCSESVHNCSDSAISLPE